MTAATYGADRTSLLVAATGFHQIGTHAAHGVNGRRDVNPIVVRERGAGCVVIDALVGPRRATGA